VHNRSLGVRRFSANTSLFGHLSSQAAELGSKDPVFNGQGSALSLILEESMAATSDAQLSTRSDMFQRDPVV
jgi:hypothetical protein